jgi:hypothetical protein
MRRAVPRNGAVKVAVSAGVWQCRSPRPAVEGHAAPTDLVSLGS